MEVKANRPIAIIFFLKLHAYSLKPAHKSRKILRIFSSILKDQSYSRTHSLKYCKQLLIKDDYFVNGNLNLLMTFNNITNICLFIFSSCGIGPVCSMILSHQHAFKVSF